MDSYNRNGNKKRKFSQTNEDQENTRRKSFRNDQSVGCFGRCCKRKKQEIVPINREKIPSENQKTSIENVSTKRLTRSPLFNEYVFCRDVSEVYDDPCVKCTVQIGPDSWENIPRKPLQINKKVVSSIEQGKTNDMASLSRKENPDDKKLNTLKNNGKSCISDTRLNGVDRMSDTLRLKSIQHSREQKLETDYQLQNLKKNSHDLTKLEENSNSNKQRPNLSSEKQNLKETSLISNPSSNIIPEGYNWNLPSNFDQQKVFDIEPYNWDEQEYLSSLPYNSSKNSGLSRKVISNRSPHLSASDLKKSITSLSIVNSQESFSTPKFNENVDQKPKSLSNTNERDQSTKRIHSRETNSKENQSSDTGMHHTFNQLRGTYDDILISCRYFLQSFLDFMASSVQNSDHRNNLSPSNTYSWSTLIPFGNIGPWWDRRDGDDQTPATFIFVNDSSSIGTLTDNEQMCISIENRPCCLNYYSYSNPCHCYCNSSITINNS